MKERRRKVQKIVLSVSFNIYSFNHGTVMDLKVDIFLKTNLNFIPSNLHTFKHHTLRKMEQRKEKELLKQCLSQCDFRTTSLEITLGHGAN